VYNQVFSGIFLAFASPYKYGCTSRFSHPVFKISFPLGPVRQPDFWRIFGGFPEDFWVADFSRNPRGQPTL
jgi:hypothetical protein